MTKFIMMREDRKTERDRTEDSPIIEETSEGSAIAKTTNHTMTTKKPILKHLEEEKPISVRTRIKEFTAKLSDAHTIPKQETHHPETPSNSLVRKQNLTQQNGRRPSENSVGHKGISCKEIKERDRIGGNGPRGGKPSVN